MNSIDFYIISGMINCIGATSFGLFIYFKNPKSRVNIQFSIFNFTVALWSLGYVFWLRSNSPESALFWTRTLHIPSSFMSIALFHFTTTFLNIKRKKLLLAGYILSSLTALFLFTPFVFTGVRPISIFPFWGIAGPGYSLFLLNFLGYGLLSAKELYDANKNSSPQRKNQLKYILFAITIGYLFGSTNFPPFYGFANTPYLNFGVIVYVGIFVYAIAAHKLFDIDIIFRKTIVYSILATIIAIIYFGIIFTLENFFRIYYGYRSFTISFSVIMFFLILFQPLKNKIQQLIDKYFFHGSIEQIDEENIKLREELQKSEKLKAVATLAAGMAHEIKNPLTSIKTFNEYLPEKHNSVEFVEKFHRIVGSEVDRINYIVKQLLEFSKPRELHLKETDINSLLSETLNLLNNDFLKANIKIEKHYTNFPHTTVDPSQMKQVFLNLFLNAKDAIKSGGTITIITEQLKDKRISISITDTGIGINKDDLKHIFDPFFTKKDTGTGLGLSVVHGILEKHGGKIAAKSTIKKGTEFIIILPA